MNEDQRPLFCDHCSTVLNPGRGEFYVVRIEAVADPSPPSLPEHSLEDIGAQITALFKKLDNLGEQEAMDQVFRRVVLHLCTRCYNLWIESPTTGIRNPV